MVDSTPAESGLSIPERAARLSWWLIRGGWAIEARLFGATRDGDGGRVAALRLGLVRQLEFDEGVFGEPRRGGPREGGPRQGGGGKRGEVGEYGYAARRRHREAVWAVEPALLPRRVPDGRILLPCSFVTLTYRRWPPEPERWKHDLRHWWRRVDRAWPGAWAVWCLEFQGRGAPHFHLLVSWEPERDAAGWRERQRWISRSWAEVVAGPGRDVDELHLRAGTNCKPVVGAETIAEYLAKPDQKGDGGGTAPAPALHVGHMAAAELAKRAQKSKGGGVGRWWGIVGRAHYQRARSVFELSLPVQTAARLAVVLRADWERWAQARGVELKRWPKWASGPAVLRIIEEARAARDLFGAEWVCPETGEVLPPSASAPVVAVDWRDAETGEPYEVDADLVVDEADLGAAASAR